MSSVGSRRGAPDLNIRKTHRWRVLSERLKWELPPVCWVCGSHIDRSLPKTNRWCWSLDHVVPIRDLRLLPAWPENAYDPANLRPAHMKCNSDRAAGIIPQAKTSRRW
jgi:5-methylcytosine-specific restriction endonuclease McrA